MTNVATANALGPGSVSVGPVTGVATSSAVQRVGFTLQKAVDEPTYENVGDVLDLHDVGQQLGQRHVDRVSR